MLFLGGPLVWCYLKLIKFSSKITISGEAGPDQIEANGEAHIFVFWHNRQALLPLLRPNDTIYCLISASRDGDYMTKAIRYFGKRAIRGSSSRNGLMAMKEIMRVLRAGDAVAIATDGPRGPAFEVKPGAVQIAQALQLPIIPVSFEASRKKVLNSWDSSYVIYPFGKIAVVYGDAIRVSREQSIEAACEQVKTGLLDAARAADSMLEKAC